MKKRRILGYTDYGTSGLAYNLRMPLTHWHEQGHEVWQLGIGFDGNLANVDRKMYPFAERLIPCHGPAPRGHTEVPAAIADIAPDVFITGIDLWMLHYFIRADRDQVYAGNPLARAILRERSRQYAHMAFFPLENLTEGGYLPNEVESVIGGVDLPICYSRFSHEAILRSTGLDVPCIPLTVDPRTFHPRDPAIFRRRFNIPDDAFLVLMIGTNQWRKLWGEFTQVMQRLTKRHSNVRIVAWTQFDYRLAGGFDMRDLFYRADLGPYLVDTTQHVDRENDDFMAEMYSASDVLVLSTAAEGAGLPPLFARACGTPALVSNNTANTEFAGDPFELIPSSQSGLHHGFYGVPNTLVYHTDIDVLDERLEILYQNPSLRAELGEAGRKAMEKYAPEHIFSLWDLALEAATA